MVAGSGSEVRSAAGARVGSDRINPDSIVTLWLTVGLVCFLAVASFMVSFTGLHEVAAWAGLPVWLRWAVPVFIDVAILAYTMAVLIHRHRGERTWASWVSLAGFTLFSVVANAAHALSIGHPDDGQRIIGAAVAALAPVAVFAATEQLGRLVIRHPDHQHAASMFEADEQHAPGTGLPEITSARETLVPTGGPQPAEPRTSGPADAGEEEAPVAVEPADMQSPALADRADKEPSAAVDPVAAADPPQSDAARPVLRVVGRKPKPADFQTWVRSVVASGEQPTGKDAADFLGVSERTGRARLNALKKSDPQLFSGAARKEGNNP